MIKRPSLFFPIIGYLLNIPPLVIWATIGLSTAGNPLGETLAAWFRDNFSDLTMLVYWIGFPAAAMVFGVTGFATGKHNKLNAALVGLSTVLLIGLTFAAMNQVG